MAQRKQNNKMSLEEAGRKGGNTTSRNHDQEFYQDIGEKGGNQRARRNNEK